MSRTPAQQTVDLDEIQNPKVNASALDFLLIELVPLAQRVTERLQAREQALLEEHQRSKILNTSNADVEVKDEEGTEDAVDGGKISKSAKGAASSAEDAERQLNSLGWPTATPAAQEAMALRLGNMGYRVGQGLVERYDNTSIYSYPQTI